MLQGINHPAETFIPTFHGGDFIEEKHSYTLTLFHFSCTSFRISFVLISLQI